MSDLNDDNDAKPEETKDDEVKQAIKVHLIATWFHGIKGPSKKSSLKPKEQFHDYINKTTESVFDIIRGRNELV